MQYVLLVPAGTWQQYKSVNVQLCVRQKTGRHKTAIYVQNVYASFVIVKCHQNGCQRVAAKQAVMLDLMQQVFHKQNNGAFALCLNSCKKP